LTWLGDHEPAERELTEGIAVAEAVGDRRLASMLSSYRAHSYANLGRLDEALVLARESFDRAETLGLLYSRTEAHRCLGLVHFKRGELDEVVRLSERIIELTAETDARVSKLWLGPLHIEALLALGRRDEASETLATYAEMVADCQSPHFSREVSRLQRLVG